MVTESKISHSFNQNCVTNLVLFIENFKVFVCLCIDTAGPLIKQLSSLVKVDKAIVQNIT